MLELPEAAVIAEQIRHTLTGKEIGQVIANHSPHKFAFFSGDPTNYPLRLGGKTIRSAEPYAGMVEIKADDLNLLISAPMRYHPAGDKLPVKHQLFLAFRDGSAFSASVQMWGGLFCFSEAETCDYIEYSQAMQKPSPLSEAFDRAYFETLFDENSPKLSVKAFLATEQRIPGLGNGVLQDILWASRIHPKRKVGDLSTSEIDQMYLSVKNLLQEMTNQGGRDTEKDLFGCPGGYITVLSKNTAGGPCPACGTIIKKEAYMGGSIYYCEECQK